MGLKYKKRFWTIGNLLCAPLLVPVLILDTHTDTHTCTHKHTQTYTGTHTKAHRHTYTQRHTDIHTHTDTHTHTRSPQGACIWQKGMPAEVLKSMESHGLAPVECFSALWNDSLFVHTALPERLYLCHHGGRKSKG